MFLRALLLSFLVLCACTGVRGSGVAKEEARPVGPYHAVEVSGALRVKIAVQPGAVPAVVLRGDDNLLAHVKTVVTSETLSISAEGNLSPKQPLVATLTTDRLDRLGASGAVRLAATGLHGPDLTARVSGAAAVVLQGEVTATTLEVSGAAEIDAQRLKARSVRVDLSGVGDVQVQAVDSLHAAISGAGRVAYVGKPAKVTQSISGVGVLKQKDQPED